MPASRGPAPRPRVSHDSTVAPQGPFCHPEVRHQAARLACPQQLTFGCRAGDSLTPTLSPATRTGGIMAARPVLPGVLASVAPLLDHYGYLAVAGLLVLENLGLPVPGETVLIAGSLYAGAGRLNIVAVGVRAVAASVVGSCIGYVIGRFGGRALVERYGKYVLLTGERLDKAEAFFDHRGGVIIVIARFIDGLRQAAGIIAGTTEMRFTRFLALTTLGAVLWVATWTSVGYLAGDHITVIYREVTRYSLYVLIALALLAAGLIVRYLLRRRPRPS